MNRENGAAVLAQVENGQDEFLQDVIEGLSSDPKRIPSKYFYDEKGSRLFDEICELPEYYPTRTELKIMERYAGDMAERIGPECELVELGSGSSVKIRMLLDELDSPAAYVPMDISGEHLARAARALARDYPHVPILPTHADFTEEFAIPEPPRPVRRRVVYFPGSTIGNFEPHGARSLMRRIARVAGTGGGFLVGVDLVKDRRILEAAYNDSRGVTAAFNLNMLTRMRRELGAVLRPERFAHHAFFNEVEGRIEMHLLSLDRQSIWLEDFVTGLDKGESIHTENSYKYRLDQFEELAAQAGMRRLAVWTDPERLFSVQYFEVAEGSGDR